MRKNLQFATPTCCFVDEEIVAANALQPKRNNNKLWKHLLFLSLFVVMLSAKSNAQTPSLSASVGDYASVEQVTGVIRVLGLYILVLLMVGCSLVLVPHQAIHIQIVQLPTFIFKQARWLHWMLQVLM